jgi:hypothetical protein
MATPYDSIFGLNPVQLNLDLGLKAAELKFKDRAAKAAKLAEEGSVINNIVGKIPYLDVQTADLYNTLGEYRQQLEKEVEPYVQSKNYEAILPVVKKYRSMIEQDMLPGGKLYNIVNTAKNYQELAEKAGKLYEKDPDTAKYILERSLMRDSEGNIVVRPFVSVENYLTQEDITKLLNKANIAADSKEILQLRNLGAISGTDAQGILKSITQSGVTRNKAFQVFRNILPEDAITSAYARDLSRHEDMFMKETEDGKKVPISPGEYFNYALVDAARMIEDPSYNPKTDLGRLIGGNIIAKSGLKKSLDISTPKTPESGRYATTDDLAFNLMASNIGSDVKATIIPYIDKVRSIGALKQMQNDLNTQLVQLTAYVSSVKKNYKGKDMPENLKKDIAAKEVEIRNLENKSLEIGNEIARIESSVKSFLDANIADKEKYGDNVNLLDIFSNVVESAYSNIGDPIGAYKDVASGMAKDDISNIIETNSIVSAPSIVSKGTTRGNDFMEGIDNLLKSSGGTYYEITKEGLSKIPQNTINEDITPISVGADIFGNIIVGYKTKSGRFIERKISKDTKNHEFVKNEILNKLEKFNPEDPLNLQMKKEIETNLKLSDAEKTFLSQATVYKNAYETHGIIPNINSDIKIGKDTYNIKFTKAYSDDHPVNVFVVSKRNADGSFTKEEEVFFEDDKDIYSTYLELRDRFSNEQKK